ncbi:MAG TPA: hypothetical protein DER10_02010 [Elusimicrobia bacterium]|nr:hypothetical protein [Elusimicrobiota bacterium]HCE97252.1 hypothetical protein [Elusimicrobiota bacterium]
MQVTGHRSQARGTENKLHITGYWLLVTGHWLLFTGHFPHTYAGFPVFQYCRCPASNKRLP